MHRIRKQSAGKRHLLSNKQIKMKWYATSPVRDPYIPIYCLVRAWWISTTMTSTNTKAIFAPTSAITIRDFSKGGKREKENIGIDWVIDWSLFNVTKQLWLWATLQDRTADNLTHLKRLPVTQEKDENILFCNLIEMQRWTTHLLNTWITSTDNKKSWKSVERNHTWTSGPCSKNIDEIFIVFNKLLHDAYANTKWRLVPTPPPPHSYVYNKYSHEQLFRSVVLFQAIILTPGYR